MTSYDYVAGRVQEALAHAGETDVHVAVDGSSLVLSGNVATAERHAQVVSLVTAEADGFALRDEVTVLRLPEPDLDRRETIG